MKIAHAEAIPADNYSEYVYAAQENKELQNLLPKTKFTLLDPLHVQVLFSKIEKEVRIIIITLKMLSDTLYRLRFRSPIEWVVDWTRYYKHL